MIPEALCLQSVARSNLLTNNHLLLWFMPSNWIGPQLTVRCTSMDHPNCKLPAFLAQLALCHTFQVIYPIISGMAHFLVFLAPCMAYMQLS
jgi:hypothetical protein